MMKLRLDLDELEVTTFQPALDGANPAADHAVALWTNTTDNCISKSDVKLCLGTGC